MLKPVPDASVHLDRKMEDAVRLFKKYNCKVIWSTTFPISLAKYHKSQGYDINDMSWLVIWDNVGLTLQYFLKINSWKHCIVLIGSWKQDL